MYCCATFVCSLQIRVEPTKSKLRSVRGPIFWVAGQFAGVLAGAASKLLVPCHIFRESTGAPFGINLPRVTTHRIKKELSICESLPRLNLFNFPMWNEAGGTSDVSFRDFPQVLGVWPRGGLASIRQGFSS